MKAVGLLSPKSVGFFYFFEGDFFYFFIIMNYADMAQLAAQLICNQKVEGSTPSIGSEVGLYGGEL